MKKLIVIMLLLILVLSLSVGSVCIAEETSDDDSELRNKLWFIDDAIFNIVMSAMGTLSALGVVLWKIVKTLKEVKGATEDTVGKKEELQKLIEDAKQQIQIIADLRDKMIEELDKANGAIGTIKEMCEIAFTRDTEMVLDGRAEQVAIIGERNETND
jgi:hypothetical protein